MMSEDSINKAFMWIKNNSNDEGVFKSEIERIVHTEVSGYFIPTLINYGKIDIAIKWAKHLNSIQKENGLWNNLQGRDCLFFTAQILDGLTEFKEYNQTIEKSMNTLVSIIKSNGEFKMNYYPGNALRILYCMKKSAKHLKSQIYDEDINKSIDYYISRRPFKFNTKSHFWAYGMEGCVRLDKPKTYEKYIEVLEHYDYIPSTSNFGDDRISPTGIAQVANAIYLSGKHLDIADKYMKWLTDNQKENGGFLKGYSRKSHHECSWAIKFFLDANYNRNRGNK